MKELYAELLDLPVTVRKDDSIAQMMSAAFSRRYNQDMRPKEYYYLTELCNPIQAFWARTRSNVCKSKQTAQKLARGNLLQNRAYYWMRRMPEYVSEEAYLVGDYVGVSKVVGKYDVRFGNSIVEFKTKPENVADARTVFEKYPHDLEQLCFYAALSPQEMKTHYLVFQLDHKPYDLHVFRVDVNNIGAIRHIMKQRINLLDNALATSDPTRLPKCRYYDSGCDFGDQQICACAQAREADVKALQKAASVSEDKKKKAELERCRDELSTDHGSALRAWDLLLPRKYFLRCVVGQTDDYEADNEQIAYKDSLRKALLRSDALKPLPSELKRVRASAMNLPILATWSYMAIHDPELGCQRRRVVPVLLKVSKSEKPFTSIPPSYKAEIAIAKIMSSKSAKGAILVIHPKANDAIQAFIVSSQEDTLARGEGLLRDAASALNRSIEQQDISGLETCPEWARKGCKECPGTCDELMRKLAT
jgi:hypothetical protein